MKKRLLTLSLALSAVIGASAGYTSGNFYYNEAARYKVIGENQLTGTDLSGGLTGMGFTHEGAALGEAITDTFEIVNGAGPDGMNVIQVNKTGGQNTGGAITMSHYLTTGIYLITYKVKGTANETMSTSTASGYNSNFQSVFLNNDGTTTCDATADTGNGGQQVSAGYHYSDTWKEMSYVVTVGEDKYAVFYFFNLAVGDQFCDFGIYPVQQVGDDRKLSELLEIAKGYYANTTDFPNDRDALAETISFIEQDLEDPEGTTDVAAVEEAVNYYETSIADFLNANTVDVSNFIVNFDFSGGNEGEAKGVKNWTPAGGHTNRWGTFSQYSTRSSVDFGEGKYGVAQVYPQGMSDGSDFASLSQSVTLPAGRYMFTVKAAGNINYRIDGKNKYGVTVTDSVDGMGIAINADTLYLNTVRTVSPTVAHRYSMIGNVKEGDKLTLSYLTGGMPAKNGRSYAFSPVEIRLLGGATQADVDAFFYSAVVADKSNALKVMVDSAYTVHAKDLYLYGKDNLKVGADHGQAVYDEFSKVFTQESVDTLSNEMNHVRDSIRAYYALNADLVALKQAIEVAEGYLADEARPSGKSDFKAVIDEAKAFVAGLKVENRETDAEGIVAMTTKLLNAQELYFLANSTYDTPGEITVINPYFANKGTGWNITSSAESKEAWKYGSDNRFIGGTKIYANRGNTTSPDNAALQTVNLKANGLYEINFQAYSWGQGRHDGAVTESNNVYFVTTIGEKTDSIIVHTVDETPVNYTVRLLIDNAPVDLTFGIDALNNNSSWPENRSEVFATSYAYGGNSIKYYGAYDKYLADSIAAVLKPTRDSLQVVINNEKALFNEVRNPNNVNTSAFTGALATAQAVVDNANATLDEINAQFPLLANAHNKFITSGVLPAVGKYFDLSTVMVNTEFNQGDDNFDGWTWEAVGASELGSDTIYCNGKGMLFKYYGTGLHNSTGYSKLSQTIENLPAGNYLFLANATWRRYTNSKNINIDASAAADYTDPNQTMVTIFANDAVQSVVGILAAPGGVVSGEGEGSKYTLPGGESFDNYAYTHTVDVLPLFQAGYYRNEVAVTLAATGSVNFGLNVDNIPLVSQVFFYAPELRFYGDQEATGINDINAGNGVSFNNGAVYSINGVRVGNSLEGLAKGLYIINGKKYVVK